MDNRMITPELAAVLIELLENPAAHALAGWKSELPEDEFKELEDRLNAALSALGSKHTFQTLRRFHG